MNYTYFNKEVLEFYVERRNTSFCNLAIDEFDVSDIVVNLPFFEELKRDWNKLLEAIDDIPQYFGLIAIQCFAASQRQADAENDIGENEYQVRLRNLLGIENDTILQQLYRGQDNQNPIQEQIWFAAKDFLQVKFGLELNIPNRNAYAGRYVQYPKSQSLLTKEDLKRFTFFFSEQFQVDEDISFDYFQKQCKDNIQNLVLRQRTINLLNDTQKQKLCYQQIFNYFSHWEGQVYIFERNINQPQVRQNQDVVTSRLMLLFDDNEPKFYLDSNEIALKNLFNIDKYKYFEKGILLFSEHEYYKTEYENIRVLEENKVGYIILNSVQKPNEYVFLNQNNFEKIDLGNSIFLYKVNSNNVPLGANFKVNPAKLKGGIRVNRKRTYLLGFPPTIECNEAFSIMFEHKRLENDFFSKVGVYKVRVNGYKDIEVEVKAPQIKKEIITPKNKGWDIQNLSFESSDPALEGAIFNIKKEGITQSITRSWIDLNLDKSKYKHKNNHLLIAINRAKYGNHKN